MNRKRHRFGFSIIALVLAVLLTQSACNTEDLDLDVTPFPKVVLSQNKAEISAGQTITATAKLIDVRGKSYPANWSCENLAGERISSVTINPSAGVSSATVTITAASDGFYKEGSESPNPQTMIGVITPTTLAFVQR